MHNQQPPGVVQNWSTLQCSKQNTEQCGYDHAPVTRGRMRAQFPLPHGPRSSFPPGEALAPESSSNPPTLLQPNSPPPSTYYISHPTHIPLSYGADQHLPQTTNEWPEFQWCPFS